MIAPWLTLPVLWLTVACCLPAAIVGRNRLLFAALATFAAAATLGTPEVYRVVDAAFGGRDLAYWLLNLLLLAAVGLFAVIVELAMSDGRVRAPRIVVVTGVLVVLAVVQTTVFARAARFVATGEPRLAPWEWPLYLGTGRAAIGALAVAAIVAMTRDLRRQADRVIRAGLVVALAGCAIVLLDLALLAGATLLPASAPLAGLAERLGPLVLGAGVLGIAVGLGLRPVVSAGAAAAIVGYEAWLLTRLTRVWRRRIAVTPEVALDHGRGHAPTAFLAPPGARLYRRYVEVRDSILLSPEPRVSESESRLMTSIERFVDVGGQVRTPGPRGDEQCTTTPKTARISRPRNTSSPAA